MKEVICQLDAELFTCCKCKGQFSHVDGTWLPIAFEKKRVMRKVSKKKDEPPKVFMWDLRPPEIITSDEFTCYNCI